MERWVRWVPAVGWLSSYRREDLRGDLLAGLTVAIMLIPQGMAYAMLAGLPPYIGLYASILPPFLYALFGTSRQLSFGPVAMDSLLVATGVGAIAAVGTERYLALAILLGVLVGVLQLAMGLLRMGFLVNFLSRPVISGFTSAAALIIGLSQLKHLLGVELARSSKLHEIAVDLGRKIGGVHAVTFLIGVVAILFLFFLKRWRPRWPGALFVVFFGTLAVWSLGLHQQGVRIVGAVPRGLPSLTLPIWDLGLYKELFPIALVIAFVAFLEGISVARAMAQREGYVVDANQELIAMGLANLGGGLTSGYPGTGGLSRSAVNYQAGAKTPLASMITSLLVALTLLFFTPLFFYLPNAVLAAIVMVAVFGLIDVKEPIRLWKVKRMDAALLGLTFSVTLFVGIQQGILVGVGVSLLLFIARSTRPHTAILGRLPGTEIYRNAKRFPEVEIWPDIVIFRIDASFYFANVAFFKEQVERLVLEKGDQIRAVIIDASSINFIDSSAATALEEIARSLREAKISLYLASVKGPVRDVLHLSGFCAMLGEEFFTFRIQDAVDAIRAHQEGASTEADAPASKAIFETGIVKQQAGHTSLGAFYNASSKHEVI